MHASTIRHTLKIVYTRQLPTNLAAIYCQPCMAIVQAKLISSIKSPGSGAGPSKTPAEPPEPPLLPTLPLAATATNGNTGHTGSAAARCSSG